jgi:hypothetical protein
MFSILPALGSYIHYDKSLSWPLSIEKPEQHIAFLLYLKDSFSDAIKLSALDAVQTSMQIAPQNASAGPLVPEPGPGFAELMSENGFPVPGMPQVVKFVPCLR